MARVGDNPNFQGLSGQVGKSNEPLKQYIEDTKNQPTKSTEKPASTESEPPPTKLLTQADIHIKRFKPQFETTFKVGNEISETLLQQVLEYARDPKNKIPQQTVDTIASANQLPTYSKNKGLTEASKQRLEEEIKKIAKRTKLQFPGSARVAQLLIEYLSDVA